MLCDFLISQVSVQSFRAIPLLTLINTIIIININTPRAIPWCFPLLYLFFFFLQTGEPTSTSLLYVSEGNSCSHCDKIFRRKCELKRHMMRHTGEYKYFCEPCKKGFAQKYRYEDHMKIHSGMRFYCNYCGNNFTSSDQLKRHLRIVHPDKQLLWSWWLICDWSLYHSLLGYKNSKTAIFGNIFSIFNLAMLNLIKCLIILDNDDLTT